MKCVLCSSVIVRNKMLYLYFLVSESIVLKINTLIVFFSFISIFMVRKIPLSLSVVKNKRDILLFCLDRALVILYNVCLFVYEKILVICINIEADEKNLSVHIKYVFQILKSRKKKVYMEKKPLWWIMLFRVFRAFPDEKARAAFLWLKKGIKN